MAKNTQNKALASLKVKYSELKTDSEYFRDSMYHYIHAWRRSVVRESLTEKSLAASRRQLRKALANNRILTAAFGIYVVVTICIDLYQMYG